MSQADLNSLVRLHGAIEEREAKIRRLMILTGFYRWLGAIALAGFTLMATLIALRFWELPAGHERFMAANAFFEHLGLVGGFLLVAWHDLSTAHPDKRS